MEVLELADARAVSGPGLPSIGARKKPRLARPRWICITSAASLAGGVVVTSAVATCWVAGAAGAAGTVGVTCTGCGAARGATATGWGVACTTGAATGCGTPPVGMGGAVRLEGGCASRPRPK